MPTEEHIAHLLRRFGLGAGRYELKRYAGKDYIGVVDALLNESKVDERFPVDLWEFAAQDDGKIETNSYIVAGWWALRLLMTRRPLQEKLTIFWHDHFALSAEKVYEAPTMTGYLEVLRQYGQGKFKDLLRETLKQGAMLTYLDGHTSNRVLPNENLARETLELFTLGEGNYSERDVKELSRALTGWSMHYLGLGLEEPYEVTAKRARDNRMALSNFCFVPALHDDGEKTILGRTARFTGDSAIEYIAGLPQTARYICTKLWHFYGSPNPNPQLVDKLVRVWMKTDGRISSVLREIALSKEFLSSSVIRQMPKSPADWTLAIYRSLDLTEILIALRGQPKGPLAPVRKELREAGGGLHYLMARQGLSLLYPPDVSGWQWGPAWISTDNTVRRIQTADALFWGGGEDRPMSMLVVTKLKTEDKVSDGVGIVKGLAQILDLDLSPDLLGPLALIADQAGGIKALSQPNSAAGLLAKVSKAMFAIPESQLC